MLDNSKTNNDKGGTGKPKTGAPLTRYTTETFIEKARQKHGDKYDYSKVEYKTITTKVCIICPIHGEFWQTPHKHLMGRGCPYCANNIKKTTESFIKEALAIHKGAYVYNKVEYKNAHTKICIICPIHGEFWQTPHNHIKHKQRCPQCFGTHLYTTKEFIDKANEVHNSKYEYDVTKYIDSQEEVAIRCVKHGIFFQKATDHLNGHGCPKCNYSHMEIDIETFLKNKNLTFIPQHHFDWLKNGKGVQKLDFYLPEYNAAIECQGIQHFKEVPYFGGRNDFEKQVERDILKKKLCEEHGIHIYYYSTIGNYENFLGERLYHDIDELLQKIENDKDVKRYKIIC